MRTGATWPSGDLQAEKTQTDVIRCAVLTLPGKTNVKANWRKILQSPVGCPSSCAFININATLTYARNSRLISSTGAAQQPTLCSEQAEVCVSPLRKEKSASALSLL